VSEWFNACSHGDDKLHAWAYGVAFDEDACAPADGSTPFPVASYPGCVGGYPGLFDMSGNVGEWTNECSFDDASCGNSAPPCCAVRGAAIEQPGPTYSECIGPYEPPIWVESPFITGGRCCADVK